jgi:hypothetical protein
MRAKFVFEKFSEQSDPINDLEIGLRYVIIKFLKNKGNRIDKNITNDKLLNICAFYDKTEWCKYLLDKGITDKNSITSASKWAIINDNTELYNLLLKSGADKEGKMTFTMKKPEQL